MFFWACNSPSSNIEDDESNIIRSFYHWKQELDLNSEQLELLKKLKIKELYVHYFDITWNGSDALPVSQISINEMPNYEIKPIVYITTAVFENLDSVALADLALKTAGKIKSIHGDLPLNEVQFDCDWTPSIKDKYFYFLSETKRYFKKSTISSTIRLYQYKYPDLAGVPPVDKGLLMYYNMGEITSYRETNSILNNKEGKKYLGFNEYPLKIDIALPNFSWLLLFQGGNFQQICGQLNETDLENKGLFKQIQSNKFIFKKDTVIGNTYFRFGDELRLEKSSEKDLNEAANLLKSEINQDKTRIIFYDLQTNTPKDYEKLDAIYSTFEL